jgi:hypothetical protein
MSKVCQDLNLRAWKSLFEQAGRSESLSAVCLLPHEISEQLSVTEKRGLRGRRIDFFRGGLLN